MKKYILVIILSFMALMSTFISPLFDYREKNYRLLLCVSSFKRPIFLSGQIFRLLNQTYRNFDISVSVKGVKPQDFEMTFQKEYNQFEKTGKVSVRYDENRAQLSNFLDTVRDVDLEKYDYFCKIDDDDWYAPDYLEKVNHAINEKQGKIGVVRTLNAHILTEDINAVQVRENKTPLCGPTLCFSKEVIKKALEMEENPELVAIHFPDLSANDFYRREDKFLDHLADEMGGAYTWNYGDPRVVFGWQYRSIMRNDGYVK